MIRITPPTAEIVSLDDAKAHLRVDHDHEDMLIQTYLDAATAWVDGFDGVLGRCVLEQTWRASAAEVLTTQPPQDASLAVINVDGTVDYTCAMPAEKVPAVRAAVLLLVAYWYEQRQAAVAANWNEAPMAVKSLLAPLRVWV